MSKQVLGTVVEARWDDRKKCIKMTLEIAISRLRMTGAIQSGPDGFGGYIDPRKLKAAVHKLPGMKVYDNTGRLDPARMTRDQLRKMRIHLGIEGVSYRVQMGTPGPDTNTFLSAMFR